MAEKNEMNEASVGTLFLRKAQYILRFLRDLFFPPRCSACGELLEWYPPRTAESVPLCPSCQRLWEREKSVRCSACGEVLPDCGCMPVRMKDANCRCFCRLVNYDTRCPDAVQSRIVFHIKRHTDRETPRFLARELLPALSGIAEQPEAWLITHIPRRVRARREYGVDQSELLARELAILTGAGFARLIDRHFSENTEQKHLTSKEREENARHAFTAHSGADCKGKNVLLVDDLVTTGASMARCVRILNRMGAAEVFCAAVATNLWDPAENVVSDRNETVKKT